MYLLFDDFQHFHGASLYANAAGDTLGNRHFGLMDHDLHGANLDALTATDTVLLVDHVNAGLGVLGNGLMLTGLHALTALDADIGLSAAILASHDLDAGIVGVKFLVKSFGTSLYTLQASHTLYIFLNSELLHNGKLSFMYLIFDIINHAMKNSNG